MMKRLVILLRALALATLIPACAFGAETGGLFSDKDLTQADPARAIDITLTENGAEITKEGIYRLSGQVANGSIRVSPDTEGTVWLLLDGVSVHNEAGAALTSSGCDKLILTLAEGSVNAFTQGAVTPTDEESGAAIYVRDDLTINGAGSLIVESANLDGINCRDSLRIADGQITVVALDDGIVGKDEVTVGGGTVVVTAKEGDGIKSTNSEDNGCGFVAISGGSVTVTTGTGSAPVTHASAGRGQDAAAAPSQKGIRAETYLNVSGGNVAVDSADDALHAVDITLSGGAITLASGDDGVHADNALAISGGEISVTRSYEGLEATDIAISGGEISVSATDDGINGAGGDSGEAGEDGAWSGGTGRFGRDMFSNSTGTLAVTGGRIYVSAAGDGVDINGDLSMSGGEMYVRGPESGGNGALDYDGVFSLTGGTLVAVGAAGMAQGVGAPSIPGTAVSVSASGALEVLDAAGASLVSFDAQGNYSHIVVYSDRFDDGESYSLVADGVSQTVQMSSQATGGGFGGVNGGGHGGGRR